MGCDGDEEERQRLEEERQRILRELAELDDDSDEEEPPPPPPLPPSDREEEKEEYEYEDDTQPTVSSIKTDDLFRSDSQSSHSSDSFSNAVPSTSTSCPFSMNQPEENKDLEEDLEELIEKGIEEIGETKMISKTVLEKIDHDRFNPLPPDWVMVTHSSGMPIYLHKPTRVISISRPYQIDSTVRNHMIPVSSVPCLFRKRLEEKEKLRREALEKKESMSVAQKMADQILSGANAGIIEDQEEFLLTPEHFNEYCSKVFKFKQIHVKAYTSKLFERTSEEEKSKKRLDNLVKRAGFRGKYEDVKKDSDEHDLLMTAPSGAVLIDMAAGAENSKNRRRKPFLLNPVGKTTVTVLNEFMQRLVKGKIEYECDDNRSVSCPYKATVWLTMKTSTIIQTGGNAKEKLTLLKEQAEIAGASKIAGVDADSRKFPIGRGVGHSKKTSRLAAAKDALSKLIPSLNVNDEYNCVGVCEKNDKTLKGFDEEATELFEKVNILSKNLVHLCIKFAITKPMSLLKDAVSRSLRWSGMNLEIRKDYVGNGGEMSKITLILGEFQETAEANGVKAATQIASQMLLSRLHPELTSYGSFLRLYGGMESKLAKDEAKKQHDQVVRLQNLGSHLQPNMAVLGKLKEEMMKVTLVHPPRRFLYGLSSSEVPFKPQPTTTIGCQTDVPLAPPPPFVVPPPIFPNPQVHFNPIATPRFCPTAQFSGPSSLSSPDIRKRPFVPDVGDNCQYSPLKQPHPPPPPPFC